MKRVLSISLLLILAFVYMNRASCWNALGDNDSAYYYGVAKHIAATGKLEEPIIWHFLTEPDTVPHAPFDYWTGGTSLILAPFFALFGASPVVSAVVMATLSVISVVFFYLVTRKIVSRSDQADLIAVVASAFFALCPFLSTFRFTPEGVVPFQVCLLITLYALLHERYLAAIFLAFPGVFFRGDGLLFFLLVAAAGPSVYACRKRLKDAWPCPLAAGLLLALYFSVNYCLHRSLTPPAAALTLSLERYADLYLVGEKPLLSFFEVLRKLISFSYIGESFAKTFGTLGDIWSLQHTVDFTFLWGFFTMLVVLRRNYWGIACALFLPLYSLALVYTQPIVFAPQRTLHVVIPLMYLMLAILLSEGLALLKEKRMRIACLAATVALCVTTSGVSNTYRRTQYAKRDMEQGVEIFAENVQSKNRTVMTNLPWWLIAYSSHSAVMMPHYNDIDVLHRLIKKYGVDYLFLDSRVYTTETKLPPDIVETVTRLTRNETVPLDDLELYQVDMIGPFLVAAVRPR